MNTTIPWDDKVSYSGVVGDIPSSQVDSELIVFVHGNSRDASDWKRYFSYFIDKGINPSRLWAISFDNSRMTHDDLSAQFEDFVTRCFNITGQNKLSYISHSLGVTVGRYWMDEYDRYNNVSNFVGIAGANHGLNVCGLCKLSKRLPKEHHLKPCQTLGTTIFKKPPIEKLNQSVGETPGDIEYYTIRGELDGLYTGNLNSPKLDGAEVNKSVWAGHDGARESTESIETVFDWTTKTE